MRIINTKEIENTLYSLILKAGKNLTPSAILALQNAKDTETSQIAKFALECCIENSLIAKKENMPICQDTGLAVVIIEIGQNVFLEGEFIEDAINQAVKNAYLDGFFRKSCCDPITRQNSKDNTPCMLSVEIVKGDKIKIYFLPKGFGSENMSKIYMLTPSKGIDGIIDCIVETVKLAGGNPCPPVLVGVGIGGTFDKCAYLAKKALLRPVGTFNLRDDVKFIEKSALDKINKLNIGAQGFKGKTTALGVNAEVFNTHIAGLPVAVNIQCHCIRCESAEI